MFRGPNLWWNSVLFTLILPLVSESKTLPPRCQYTQDYYQQRQFDSPHNQRADGIVVDKQRRLMHLFWEDTLIKTYRIGLGSHPKGPKIEDGDGRTPEGSYFIDQKNAASRYHLALHISYPDQEDLNQARREGLNPGGDIMIHGLPNEPWKRRFTPHPLDWTKGCVALNNQEIEELWALVPNGTPIDLCP